MTVNATLLAAALALVPFATRADDNKPSTNSDVTKADQSGQRMNRDSTMMNDKNSNAQGMDQKGMDQKGMTDEHVLHMLHHANMEEIKAGKMAESKGSSKGVKDFGRTLVTDHQQADKQVLAMADKMHVDIKKDMGMSGMDHSKMDHSNMSGMDHSKMDHSKMKHGDTAASADQPNSNETSMDRSNMDQKSAGMDHEKMEHAKMDQLQKMSGKQFDQAFLTMMVNGHEHVIDMVKNAQANAKDDLKNMLDHMLPTLERHKDMAQDLMNKEGNTASAK